jgi:hypothetical protein
MTPAHAQSILLLCSPKQSPSRFFLIVVHEPQTLDQARGQVFYLLVHLLAELQILKIEADEALAIIAPAAAVPKVKAQKGMIAEHVSAGIVVLAGLFKGLELFLQQGRIERTVFLDLLAQVFHQFIEEEFEKDAGIGAFFMAGENLKEELVINAGDFVFEAPSGAFEEERIDIGALSGIGGGTRAGMKRQHCVVMVSHGMEGPDAVVRTGVNRISIWSDAQYRKVIGFTPDYADVVLTSLKEDTDPDWRPRVPQWPKIGEIMAVAVQAALVKQQTPKAALDDANAQIAKVMKE